MSRYFDKKERGRFRFTFMGLGSIFCVILMLLGDPDSRLITELPFGAGVIANIIILTKAVLYISLAHIARKGLFDYLDLESFFTKAWNEGQAGQALIAVSIFFLGICALIFAAVS